MAQERECCRELVVSARFKYISMAYDYAVEVPGQDLLDRSSRCLSISNSSDSNEPMRAELPDIP
jgi:hypothetical protein